jgi:homoserine O-acetyltransferase/O-succinyltransferase
MVNRRSPQTVAAQHRLLTEGLGLRHLRLVLGNSMGGMHSWIWGVKHPDFMDVLVPMASQPVEMSSRNWMMRRLIIDSIRKDPEWSDGNYTAQPRSAHMASVFYGIATAGGTLALQKLAPTRETADKLLDSRLSAPFPLDANDVLYMWDASRDYNSQHLDWSASRQPSLQSIPQMTSAIRQRLALWSVN